MANTKTELTKFVAQKLSISQRQAKGYVKAVLAGMTNGIVSGDLMLQGVGRWTVKPNRNKQAVRSKRIAFKCGNQWKQMQAEFDFEQTSAQVEAQPAQVQEPAKAVVA
jgi:nucleoid DNA-binding protein